MVDCEAVHEFMLAEQEGAEKRLAVFCTQKKFFVMAVGSPCGDASLFETPDVTQLREFVTKYKK